ncbi:helix-turn-helix transcriptional regulator [Streptomyces sp. AK02-01A]|uniref:helix-turn-helix domain-containing protein n=1 Tax=Streptomyces sp. AK02-01A TaxID=3028648 RepID=UPI0029A24DDE|nr:helix-turn-helix transcriptional regulator [Streptomyces sp. AK02-01A]MDX3853348.1 helix-turn-helix transcriptional regulator [Streptomyces sp. AK02-01A]
MNLAELGLFLRSRRNGTLPEEVGLRSGARRRVPGLRRDEVARLAGLSLDYYTQLEQGKGSRPSDLSLAGLARALRLGARERGELFGLAGRTPPDAGAAAHVQPGLLILLDRLSDTPALVMTDLAEVLVQNPLSVTLLGDLTAGRGLPGSFVHRWFADPGVREIFPAEDHRRVGRALVADLRAATLRPASARRASGLVATLRELSDDFAALWDTHLPGSGLTEGRVRFAHPALGVIELDLTHLHTADLSQRLLWFTAPPGGTAAGLLALLDVVGLQDLRPELG